MRITMIIFLMVFTVISSSCNLPREQITPETNVIETAVAQTLTIQAIQITPLETQEIIVTPTIAYPTETPFPTETVTPTATQQTQSPRFTLGDPTRIYTFNDGAAFGLNEPYDDGNTQFAVTNGKLIMTSLNTNGFRGWRLTSPRPENFYLDGDFYTRDCSGKDLYGIVFRANDFTSGLAYYLAISCDGNYRFSKWDSGGRATIKDWTQSDKIISGGNQNHRIGIMAQNNTYSFYVNDTLVDEFSDDSLKDGGHFGVFIAGNNTFGFTVELEELTYWEIP